MVVAGKRTKATTGRRVRLGPILLDARLTQAALSAPAMPMMPITIHETAVPRLSSVVEQDVDWLARQPCLQPWATGKHLLLAQLERWLTGYIERLGLDPVEGPRKLQHLDRLWSCWRYHWQAEVKQAGSSAVDGREVGNWIRAAGDVMADVVLVTGMLQCDQAALRLLEAICRPAALRRACQLTGDRYGEGWWEDFRDSHLLDFTNPPVRLASYLGCCGILGWVRTVVTRYVADQRKKRVTLSLEDIPTPIDSRSPPEEVWRAELGRWFRTAVNAAVRALDRADLLLLFWLYVERQSVYEVAIRQGIHPGNVSRRKADALGRLHSLMRVHHRPPKAAAWQECLSDLLAQTAHDCGAIVSAALKVACCPVDSSGRAGAQPRCQPGCTGRAMGACLQVGCQ